MDAKEESELCLVFNEYSVSEHADGRVAVELKFDGTFLCALMGGFALGVIEYMDSPHSTGRYPH